jgi:hypothetical protein
VENGALTTADRRSRRGQTLLISVIILFLLLFLGAIFMAMISHNITRTSRARDVLQATKLAEAGLRYANQMLLYSEDGADWRPPLTDPASVLANDPDRDWVVDLNPNDDVLPFTRYVTEDGRFLIRVTYEPMYVQVANPGNIADDEWTRIARDINGLRRFIKIESIGRPGYVSPDDPTTFPDKPERLRRELVAYKPIGLLENLWFITNKDGLNEPMRMGLPTSGLGDPFTALSTRCSYLNGSIRVNGDLEWTGAVRIKLDPLGLGNDLATYDVVEVAGIIRHASGADVSLSTFDGGGTGSYATVYQSDSTDYTDFDGRYLDAYAPLSGRKVTRVEPPSIDQPDAGGNSTRYRVATRESGIIRKWPNEVKWLGFEKDESYNSGWFGLGRGIYISNRSDRQARDLPSQWAAPGSDGWYGWQYLPPGVEIVIYPYDLGRSDWPVQSRSWGLHPENADPFRNDPGTPDIWIRRTDGGYFIVPDPVSGDPITLQEIVLDYPDNGLIFAEGNIRIRGVVGSPSSSASWWTDQGVPPNPRKGFPLTVVSNRTIYVEGNILKERRQVGQDWVRYDDTGIALLARDNVCINTTRFTRVDTGFQLASEAVQKPYLPYQVQMSTWSPAQDFFRISFDLGIYLPDDGQNPLYLLMEHAAAQQPFSAYALSFMVTDSAFYQFYYDNFDYYPYFQLNGWAGLEVLWHPATQVYPNFAATALRLWSTGNGTYSFEAIPGVEYNMYVTPPGTAQGQQGGLMSQASDYLVERCAVEPMDVWVEAALYAQEGCFFVIPGYWLNTNENDVPDPAQGKVGSPRPVTVGDPMYPFYYEPIDARITIYGSISEDVPADLGHAMEWIEKWGWTPDTLGSSNITARFADPSPGSDWPEFNIRYIYDPAFRYWLVGSDGASLGAFGDVAGQTYRRTLDGQVLPLLPKLPVSPTMIYAGESMPTIQGP